MLPCQQPRAGRGAATQRGKGLIARGHKPAWEGGSWPPHTSPQIHSGVWRRTGVWGSGPGTNNARTRTSIHNITPLSYFKLAEYTSRHGGHRDTGSWQLPTTAHVRYPQIRLINATVQLEAISTFMGFYRLSKIFHICSQMDPLHSRIPCLGRKISWQPHFNIILIIP